MKIYIGNLHHNASEIEIRGLFHDFGTILSILLYMDTSGRSTGYGYVIMKERKDGIAAIQKLNGINFMNQFLEIYGLE